VQYYLTLHKNFYKHLKITVRVRYELGLDSSEVDYSNPPKIDLDLPGIDNNQR